MDITAPTSNIRQFRVKGMKTAAVSIVDKGAAANSDAYLLQQAALLVQDKPGETPATPDPSAEGEVEYPIVALVQTHLEALPEQDREAAMSQIVEVLEQGAVAEALASYRARYPGYQLWDVFCSAYSNAATNDLKAALIADFAEVLNGELVLDDTDALTQWAAKVGVEVEREPVAQTPAPESAGPEGAVAQGEPADDTPEPEAAADQPVTREGVEQLIIQALGPVSQALEAAKTEAKSAGDRATAAETALEQSKVELAKLKSATTPTSQQPDGDAGSAITQAEPTQNVYAGSHLDAYLQQTFPTTRR